MSSKTGKIDKPFIASVIILVVAGFFIFSSASLGIIAEEGNKYSKVVFNQTFFGLFLGTIAFIFTSRIHYRTWRRHAFWIFAGALLLTLLVFVPGIGFGHGGANRWINLGFTTFQPAELLKVAFIIYFAAWISGIKEKVKTFRYGFLPFLIILAVVGAILLKQPDTDTFGVIFFAGLAIYIAAGAPWRYIFLLVLASASGLATVAYMRPYVLGRIHTFLDPTRDSLGAGYQIQQSLLAIGSGGFFGKGFGQSIQKFNFLPEPIGDSIFAVAAEEFGFVGSSLLILLFVFFTFRGLKIAVRAPDIFGRLLVIGIVILIASQACINIAGMLGIMPLMGIPLPFVSHGGTALFITLAEVGIVVNVSKHVRRAA